MSQQYVSETTTFKKKISGPGHNDCHEMITHMENRINELARENEELRQKTQVVVKKVETNVVENKPGLDAEAAHRITELENRLSDAELLAHQRTVEIEELRSRVVKFNDLQSDFDVISNKNHHLEQDLKEKCLELEALRHKYAELEALRAKDIEFIRMKESEILALQKRFKELEALPGQLANAKKNIEILNAEVERLTMLAKERDQEIAYLRNKTKEFESLRCVNPKDHDDLRARLAYIEKLEHELADLKSNYTSLCNEYEKEIAIVRNKDKEISAVNKELQYEVKESRKAIDKEISREEMLQREIERLKKLLGEREFEIQEWKKKTVVISELQTSCKSFEAENHKLIERLRKLEEMNQQLEAKVAGLVKEIDVLRNELKHKEKDLVALQRERETMIAEFEKSQKESSAMLSKVSQAKNSEIEALNIKLSKLTQEIGALQKELEGLRRECDVLNSEKAKITKVLQEHTLQEKELFNRIEGMRKDRDLLSREIADLVAEKERLKGVAQTKGKEVGKLDKDVHQLAQENNHLRDVIAELEKKIASLQPLVNEREAEIMSLRSTLEKLTITQKELCEERDRLLGHNKTLTHRISELETSVTTITTKYNKLEKIYNEIRGATINLEHVHDKLVETCEETEKISHSGPQVVQQKTKVKEESRTTHMN